MNAAQKFNDELQKALESTPIEFKIPDPWPIIAKDALRFASPMSLGLSGKQFKELFLNPAKSWTLYQFAVLSNNLEKTTADQLDISISDYCDLVVLTNDLSDKWNAIVDKMKGEITARIVLEQQELERKSGKPGFKAIKAQA